MLSAYLHPIPDHLPLHYVKEIAAQEGRPHQIIMLIHTPSNTPIFDVAIPLQTLHLFSIFNENPDATQFTIPDLFDPTSPHHYSRTQAQDILHETVSSLKQATKYTIETIDELDLYSQPHPLPNIL